LQNRKASSKDSEKLIPVTTKSQFQPQRKANSNNSKKPFPKGQRKASFNNSEKPILTTMKSQFKRQPIRTTAKSQFSYLQRLFEYIGTQFPPPSSLLYGKMGAKSQFKRKRKANSKNNEKSVPTTAKSQFQRQQKGSSNDNEKPIQPQQKGNSNDREKCGFSLLILVP
jgi:hypothetical protein